MGLPKTYDSFEFIQAGSEVITVNMLKGVGIAGKRAMTSTSSPGFSLMQEGISYAACEEIPFVILNVMRGGPGLGNIGATQGDYRQAIGSGGHGDYRNIVLTPGNIEEMYDFTIKAFDLAFKYRMIAVVLADGKLGQAKEGPVLLKEKDEIEINNYNVDEWAHDNNQNRGPRVSTSSYLKEDLMEKHNLYLQEKYKLIEKNETDTFEAYKIDDADIVCIAYGSVSGVTKEAVDACREEGVKAGLIRPKMVWPFPSKILQELADSTKAFLTLELSVGQMHRDVRLAIEGRKPTELIEHMGGVIHTPEEIYNKIIGMEKHYR